MKRVLITGAAGFLGSHLCDRFIAEGFQVEAMDNLITGDLKNLAHLQDCPHFTFHQHDVTEYINIDGHLDHILHFASPASPIDYLKIPIQTLKVGSLGVHNCLGLAKHKGARITIASTSEIYGDPQVHPQHEEYFGHVNTIGPRGVYDEAKRFQESITMAYHRYHGLETRIVRIFNTYGPRMRLNDGRALPAFIGQALRGEDLTVFGDGRQTRSFCYVDDLVEGIYRLHFSDETRPVNVGNPDEITIGEFAEEIIALTGTDQKVVYKPLPENDPKQRRPDITRAKEILGWAPAIERAEGLKRTYAYFQTLTPEELNKSEHKDFQVFKRSQAMEYHAHETAVIDHGASIGAGTKIWHFSHIMPNAVLGERCNIGQNVVVSPGVVLGANVKVQNNVSIYEGVTCDDDVFLGPSCVFTNVTNPRSAVSRRGKYARTRVGKGASIGANATIVCGHDIGAYAFIGAGAVVTKDIPAYALVVGNPARQLGWISAFGHRLEFDENGQGICAESGEEYSLIQDSAGNSAVVKQEENGNA